MNPQESGLNYPLGEVLPAPGATVQIAPGIHWVRMGLPFALDHINLWLLDDDPGWTIVDCGLANEATRTAWEQIFAQALRGRPVQRVLATHCHPDHVGLAEWLCTRWQAMLWMTAGEYGCARMMSAALPGADGDALLGHFRRHGVADSTLLQQLEERHSYFPRLVPSMPLSYRRLQEGGQVRIGAHDWQVITGFGHSPEHASLYCSVLNVLISGDMVLPRISTNVSVLPIEPDSTPVQEYLASLGKLAALPEDVLVLPSHGKPFRGLHVRIAQQREHHRARLSEVHAACHTPQSAADIVPRMFRRPLDAHQLHFALGEALAHLQQLWHEGALVRATGSDGIVRFEKCRRASPS